MSGSRANKATLARGTRYRGAYGERYGLCSKCGKRVNRLAWEDKWLHDVTRSEMCDPRDIEVKGRHSE